MHDVRSANPYIKHVQYLGEINRLKRITIFLRTVQTLLEVDTQDRRWQRTQLAKEHGDEAEERAFIEDCRQRLEAVAGCSRYPEIYSDLLCRHLISHAHKSAQRRVPLIGDCNRIKDVARLYHEGNIKDVITALVVSYTNDPAPGKASEGISIVVSLTQRGTLKITGAHTELRRKIRAAVHALPKLPDKQDDTRKGYLDTTVRAALEKATIPGWHVHHMEVKAADYAVYDDGSLSPLDDIFPSANENQGGFYQHAFLWHTVQALPADQQQALGKFLRPRDFDGNVEATLAKADPEDIYRVLMYLRRLKRSES